MLRHLVILSYLGLMLSVILPVEAGSNDEAVKKELEALKGTWDSTSAKTDSKEGLPLFGPHVTFNGTSYFLTVGSKKLQFESGTISVDPSKTPKRFDYRCEKGPNKGKKIQGIYELKDDDLKIVISAPGQVRPDRKSVV